MLAGGLWELKSVHLKVANVLDITGLNLPPFLSIGNAG